MVSKILGSLFIIGAFSYMSLLFCQEHKNKIICMDELKKALIILKAEILFNKSSLKDAFQSIANKSKDPIDDIFYHMALELDDCKKSLKEIWSDNFSIYQDKYFSKEDLSYLISFADTLGQIDSSLQVSTIEELKKHLDRQIYYLSEKYNKNSKLYRGLGFLGGMLVSIILL